MGAGQISAAQLEQYREYLLMEEKSTATVEKYTRDIRKFYDFLDGEKSVNKEIVLGFKLSLANKYEMTSINSMLVAVNGMLAYFGFGECRVKTYKIQRKVFQQENRELKKEEYQALVWEARKDKNGCLDLIMQTICSTGIRISELQYITRQAVREGYACIFCKGKSRVILIEQGLKRILTEYCKKKKIVSGPVFVTRNGNPIDRSNIWRGMKKICGRAGVKKEKVFPHNLRHLFARTCYKKNKDIVYLADLLGHSNINTTRIYTTASGREHQKLLASLKLLL